MFSLNRILSSTLRWRTLIEYLTGTTPDISVLLRFHWWQEVYYKLHDSSFPSDTRAKKGRFMGIAENISDTITLKMLTNVTKRVISRSNVRPGNDSSAHNLRLNFLDGEY